MAELELHVNAEQAIRAVNSLAEALMRNAGAAEQTDRKTKKKSKEDLRAAEAARKHAAAVKQQEQQMSRLRSVMNQLSVAAGTLGVGFGTFKLASLAKETIQLGGRYETLGVVVNTLGKNVGATTLRIKELQKSLEQTGISMIQARNTMARMIGANVDLAHATKLARIAQDAAVIADLNSSEAFERLIYGITSGQVRVLRTMGIFVDFNKALENSAKQANKTVVQLTELEKTNIRAEAVMEAGTRIVNAYTEAMGTAAKQLRSAERYAENAQVAVGSVFLPEYTAAVFAYANALKWIGDNAIAVASYLKSLTMVLVALGIAWVAHFIKMQWATTVLAKQMLYLRMGVNSLRFSFNQLAKAYGPMMLLVAAGYALKEVWEAAALSLKALNDEQEANVNLARANTARRYRQAEVAKRLGLFGGFDPNAQDAEGRAVSAGQQWQQFLDTEKGVEFMRKWKEQGKEVRAITADVNAKMKEMPAFAAVLNREMEEQTGLIDNNSDSLAKAVVDAKAQADLQQKLNDAYGQSDEALEKIRLESDITKQIEEARIKYGAENTVELENQLRAYQALKNIEIDRQALERERTEGLEREARMADYALRARVAQASATGEDVERTQMLARHAKELAEAVERKADAEELNELAAVHGLELLGLMNDRQKELNDAYFEAMQDHKTATVLAEMEAEARAKGTEEAMKQFEQAKAFIQEYNRAIREGQKQEQALALAEAKRLQVEAEQGAESVGTGVSRSLKQALKDSQRDVARFFKDVFNEGVGAFENLFQRVREMITDVFANFLAAKLRDALEAALGDIDFGKIFSKDFKLTKNQRLGLGAAGVGMAIGGYQAGDPLMGAIGGAAAGFAVGGPVGAAVGGVVGFVGGIIGAGKAAKEAAKRMRELRDAIDRTLTQAELEAANNQYALQQQQIRDAAAEQRKKLKEAYPTGEYETLFGRHNPQYDEYQRQLDRINKLEMQRLALLWAQQHIAMMQMRQDYRVRTLRAQGAKAEADAMEFELQQSRERAALLKELGDQAKTSAGKRVIAALDEAQAAERLARAAEIARQKAEALEDLQVRLLRATGAGREADDLAFALQQQREYNQAVRDGADATYLAMLAQVQAAEAAERLAQVERDRTRRMEDLDIRFRQAIGADTREAELVITHLREMADAMRAGADDAELAALAQVHLAEMQRLQHEMAIEAAEAELDAAEKAIKAHEDNAERLLDIAKSLRETSREIGLFGASPAVALAEARAEFERVAKLAMAGDEEAARRLPELARTFTQLSRDFNASGMAFQQDLSWVQAILDQVAAAFEDQATYEQTMLDEAIKRRDLAQEHLDLAKAEFEAWQEWWQLMYNSQLREEEWQEDWIQRLDDLMDDDDSTDDEEWRDDIRDRLDDQTETLSTGFDLTVNRLATMQTALGDKLDVIARRLEALDL